MHDYSLADGFVDVSEGLGDMMTSLANEPSVGLFYVQQHVQNAVPDVVSLRNKIVAKSWEIGLHTEDSEDSIAVVRSMGACGFAVVDDMIKDVAKCLAVMSSRKPRRGLISGGSVSGFRTGRAGSWGRTGWRGNVDDGEKSTALLSSVFESAKEKESDINWAAQEETANDSDTMLNVGETTLLSLVFKSVKEKETDLNWAGREETANGSDTMLNVGEELPVSSPVLIGNEEEDVLVDSLISNGSGCESLDGFKAGKEVRFEEWLGGNDTQHKRD